MVVIMSIEGDVLASYHEASANIKSCGVGYFGTWPSSYLYHENIEEVLQVLHKTVLNQSPHTICSRPGNRISGKMCLLKSRTIMGSGIPRLGPEYCANCSNSVVHLSPIPVLLITQKPWGMIR
jgi:hypothetical protein